MPVETPDSQAKRQSPPDRAIAAVAAGQHNVVTLAQLEAAGLDYGAVQYRDSIGRLRRLHRGVYAIGQAPLTHAGRALAAALAVGADALVSHVSAAVLWGLLSDFGGPIEVVVARQLRPRRGIRIHCVRQLAPTDRGREQGIPITSVARTLLDLTDTASEPALRRATGLALADHKVSEQAIRDQLTRAGGRRGAHRLAALIADGPAPTRSELEDRMLALIRRHGLPRPLVNARLAAGLARAVEVDFLFADHRLVVETDGQRYHGNPVAQRKDAAKQAMLEAAGYRVLRVTWDQIRDQPRQTVQRIHRLLN